eukprot:scaffold659688_cov89-Prasinocladus_malaysianus.AAC.1
MQALVAGGSGRLCALIQTASTPAGRPQPRVRGSIAGADTDVPVNIAWLHEEAAIATRLDKDKH